MSPKLPAAPVLSISGRRAPLVAAGDRGPGIWTGTREGLVSTLVVMTAALLFGGSAGNWFAADGTGWLGPAARIGAGSFLMALMVALSGSLLAGRNAIYWGVGMPLVAYGAGAFCALMAGHAGAAMFFFGSPLFCGLAVLGGLLGAFSADRAATR